VFLGLLTVDPKGRLAMQDLLDNEWIRGIDKDIFSTTPLATPDVLSLTRSTMSKVQNQISATMNAFHKAHRAGFRLQDISKAPLARRRKLLREEGRSSGSTDSSRASTPVPQTTVPTSLSPTVSAVLINGGSVLDLSGIDLGHILSARLPFGTELGGGPSSSVFATNSDSSIVVNTSDSSLSHFQNEFPDNLSVGFSPANSPASGVVEGFLSQNSTPRHSPAMSRSSTPRHFANDKHLEDVSDGSSPRRSPLFLECNQSCHSMGFSPCGSVSGDSESKHNNTSVISEVISESSLPGSPVSSDHIVRGKKRPLPNSTESQESSSFETTESLDDDCIIIGTVESIPSLSTNMCKKIRSSTIVIDD